ncbi:MAG TPA: DNRLRE domain-containing protein [Sedimentisphaerales bacterium]|nr:DNRLRE domain-containing protein [Sedimentisphaerales bacterium]
MKCLKLTLVVMLVALATLSAPARGSTQGYAQAFPTDDTYVDEPDTGPHGGSPFLYAGDTIEGLGGACRTFLRFQLPELPPGAAITHAQLCLYSQQSEPAALKRTIAAYSVPPEIVWDEETATWANPPGFAWSYNPAPTDSVTSNFWPGWTYWNVTADVEYAYAGGIPLYSAALIMEGEPDNVWNAFYSKEQPLEANYSPRLNIVYDLPGKIVTSGSECWITEKGSVIDFSTGVLPPIEVEFFGPGSDPFDGIIYCEGEPAEPAFGGADTIVERKKGVFLPGPDPCEVQVEMVALNLVSTEPIRVTYDKGAVESFFDVCIQLEVPSPGQMTLSAETETGGTFQYDYINPSLRVVFTNVDDPAQTYTLYIPGPNYPNLLALMQFEQYPWQESPDKSPPCGYDGFYPTDDQPLLAQLLYGALLMPCGQLLWSPPKPVNPQFALISLEDWEETLGSGNVQPMGQQEGQQYLLDFDENLEEGEPYPDTEFVTPDLYVYESNKPPSGAGLVMVWGDPCATDGNYAGAWKYEYDKDPDLSNCTVTVTVGPPCGMRVVSLGLEDAAGRQRGWYWRVAPNPGPPPPGMIQCSPAFGQGGTTITIDLSQTGLNAATPTASSYSNNPFFDITNIKNFIFDEDNVFVGATQAPAPGSGIAASWNYWYNLIVATKVPPVTGGLSSKYYVKWGQRPLVQDANQPNILLGWNEYSNYNWRPIVADDWLCTDNRPITDIHWWGSFFWWTQPTAPPVLPQAFHIGIWSDVPVGMDPCVPFSHPGMLIWENYCDNYVWSFAGYDTFPGMDPNLPKETCFQFNQLLSEDEWFYQDPCAPWDPDPRGTVYWLSISAIYGPTQPWTPYQWGWKTRKPSWNDDAVAIFDVEYQPFDWPVGYSPPTWPPGFGAWWKAGTPIEFPAGVSWDMAFELTTNRPGPNDLISDLNNDGAVDFKDFAKLANEWLKSSSP